VLRRGLSSNDFFYSGTFSAGGYRIGFLRIPNYGPPSTTAALAELDGEIAFFQATRIGLVIDEMRNNGGNLCFGENVMTRFALGPSNLPPLRYASSIHGWLVSTARWKVLRPRARPNTSSIPYR